MVSTLTPSQLRALLAKTIPAGMPVLITGAPGIGKSDIVAQAAEDAQAEMILSHPAVSDPTDAKGLPWAEKGAKHATFLPFGEMARALAATRPTVWFLDDLGQAPPAVQASFMQLLLARRVNGHVLPDCVSFIAATNRRVDRAGVSGILEPVKSRFATIVELRPDLDDWCQWAYDHEVAPELISFLRFRSELLCKFEPSQDLTNSPLPRTWSHADRLLKLKLPDGLEHQAIAGAVGDGAAVEFSAFLRMYKSLPSIDALLADPDSVPVPKEPATLYAVCAAVAARATVRNFGRIARFAQRMLDDLHGEFAVLMIRDACRAAPAVMASPEFTKLAASNLGQLMTGGSAR